MGSKLLDSSSIERSMAPLKGTPKYERFLVQQKAPRGSVGAEEGEGEEAVGGRTGGGEGQRGPEGPADCGGACREVRGPGPAEGGSLQETKDDANNVRLCFYETQAAHQKTAAALEKALARAKWWEDWWESSPPTSAGD